MSSLSTVTSFSANCLISFNSWATRFFISLAAASVNVKARIRDKGTRGLSSIHLFTNRDTSTFVFPAPADAETTIPIPEELQATDCSADN